MSSPRVYLAALALSVAATLSFAASEPLILPVWPGVPPGSEGQNGAETVRIQDNEHIVSNVHRPTLTVYLPDKPNATRTAVLVIPGGGHRELWMDHEGYAIAEALRAHGIAAFILKYRLARQEHSPYSVEKHSLADAQRALQLIRSRAKEWNVDPAHLGVIGFSAGGELAGLAASHVLAADPSATDPIARETSRPAFQGLIYPGNAQSIRPTKNSPPAFLLCGENDHLGIANELPALYLRFRAVGVSAELHILANTGHGFGLRAKNTGATAHWFDYFTDWLATIIPAPKQQG